MKIEITYVPTGKKILEFLKEMKSQSSNAWYLLHNHVISYLYENEECSVDTYMIGCRTDWRLVSKIEKYHDDEMIDFIDFSSCTKPENIFFIDM